MRDIIFPAGNRREYEDVAADIRDGITPHFVDTYEQVFALAFPEHAGVMGTGETADAEAATTGDSGSGSSAQ